MKNALLVVAISLLAAVASGQNQPACNANEKGVPTVRCVPGKHPEANCVCDGPSGPCHWVWSCAAN
jgi:hypothetical protein